MILLTSSLIIILYLCIRWLYKEYRLNKIEEDFISLQDELRINRLERRVKMNEQLLDWLWVEIAKAKMKDVKSNVKKGEKK